MVLSTGEYILAFMLADARHWQRRDNAHLCTLREEEEEEEPHSRDTRDLIYTMLRYKITGDICT